MIEKSASIWAISRFSRLEETTDVITVAMKKIRDRMWTMVERSGFEDESVAGIQS